MYAPFFGFSKEPFSIAPDPRFLYMSEQHREALAHLLYGLGGGGGFVLLTGEVGAGKTTVCRCFLEQVPAHCTVAYVFNPKLTAIELLQTVCGEFGITPPAQSASVKAHVDALNSFLLAAHAQGRQAVLVIDEAQSLSPDVLEQLRLLTNLETAERKLLQIVLIGQPELRDMVARPELEQLAQRITARFHLGALSLPQTQHYISHRLSVAGPSAAAPFSTKVMARIHALSGGVPRRINLLADRALLGAYAQGQQRAERRTVDQAAREVFGSAPRAARALGPGASAVFEVFAVSVAGVVLAALALVVLAGGAWPRWWATAPAEPSRAVAAVQASAAGSAAASSSTSTSTSTSTVAAAVSAASAAAAPATTAPTTAAATPPASAAAAPVAEADATALLAAAYRQSATAWRELALRWNVAIGEGEPCATAAQAQLACFRSAGGLAVVRQLARPGLLTLQGPGGAPLYALLVALNDSQATLQVGQRRFVLPLPMLVGLWRGDFATFWRTPPGWREGADASADATTRAWLAAPLAAAGFGPGAALAQRVWAFQLAQGLPPDGRAGPMTLMRLNRSAGVAEPRLLVEP